jgi:hypothetical protein
MRNVAILGQFLDISAQIFCASRGMNIGLAQILPDAPAGEAWLSLVV